MSKDCTDQHCTPGMQYPQTIPAITLPFITPTIQYPNHYLLYLPTFISGVQITLLGAINKNTHTMPALLSHDRFLTTSEDIKRTLKNCFFCTKLTNNTSFIMTDIEFASFKLPLDRKKAFFFLFVHNDQTRVGHWISVAIYRQNTTCLLIDPLNSTPRTTILYTRLFCRLNSLKLHFFNTLFQGSASRTCGYLNMYFCSRVSLLPLNKILSLKSVINKHTIESNELLMLRYVQTHFKIKLL